MWLIISLIGYAALAIVGLLDKYLLSQARLRPVAFTFYSTVFVLPILLLVPWVDSPVNMVDWVVAAMSGVTFALGLWTMYVGLKDSEVSHLGPLTGGAVPIFVAILGGAFLGEQLSQRNVWALVLLTMGMLVISVEHSRRHHGWHRGMLWGILSGFLFAVSHVASKYIYDGYGFLSGLVWTRGFMGTFGFLLLCLPALRLDLFGQTWYQRWWRKMFQPQSPANRLALVGVNKILGVAGALLVQYAIALGSVSLVNALAGAQYALLILLVAILSRFWPRIFKEDYSKLEIAQEAVAVVMIGIGLSFLI